MQRAPIAVFFALESESGYFEDRLQDAHHTHGAGFRLVSGTVNELDFISVRTGTGVQNAVSVVETVCRLHQPRLVISAGFAGGLSPTLGKGSLFFPDEFVFQGKSSKIEDLAPSDTFRIILRLDSSHLPEELRSESRFGGRLLTVKQVVTAPNEKEQLGFRFHAKAVDMETWGVAGVCKRLQIPFLSVRVVSDASDEPLPRDVQKLVQQQTSFSRWGAALQMVFSRPGSVKDLFHLYETSVEGATRLADVLTAIAESDLLNFISERFVPPQESLRLLEKTSGEDQTSGEDWKFGVDI